MFRRILFFSFTFTIAAIQSTNYFWPQNQAAEMQEKLAERNSETKMTSVVEECDNTPIARLNEGVQLRFQLPEKGFGMARMAPTQYHIHDYRLNGAVRFSPRTVQELVAVNELEEEGWSVGFYLVGRSILGERPDKELWDDPKRPYYGRKPINNPLLITKNTKADELPKAWTLWDAAQKAMRAFEQSNQLQFDVEEWTVAARPIRASEHACLVCHLGDDRPRWPGRLIYPRPSLDDDKAKSQSPGYPPEDEVQESKLKIGDTLGVALYAYKRPTLNK